MLQLEQSPADGVVGYLQNPSYGVLTVHTPREQFEWEINRGFWTFNHEQGGVPTYNHKARIVMTLDGDFLMPPELVIERLVRALVVVPLNIIFWRRDLERGGLKGSEELCYLPGREALMIHRQQELEEELLPQELQTPQEFLPQELLHQELEQKEEVLRQQELEQKEELLGQQELEQKEELLGQQELEQKEEVLRQQEPTILFLLRQQELEHKALTYCFPASVETTASGQEVVSYIQGTLEGGAFTAQPSTSTTVSMQDVECNESPAAATAVPASSTSFPSDVVQAPAVQQEESVEDEVVRSGEVEASVAAAPGPRPSPSPLDVDEPFSELQLLQAVAVRAAHEQAGAQPQESKDTAPEQAVAHDASRLPEQKEQHQTAPEPEEPAPSAEEVETAWNDQFMPMWREIHHRFISQVDDLTQRKLAASAFRGSTKVMQEVERKFMRTFAGYLKHVSDIFRGARFAFLPEVRGAFLGMGAILLGLGEHFEYYF